MKEAMKQTKPYGKAVIGSRLKMTLRQELFITPMKNEAKNSTLTAKTQIKECLFVCYKQARSHSIRVLCPQISKRSVKKTQQNVALNDRNMSHIFHSNKQRAK
jgi:hypothetical protein